jgi:hypothetical protein
MRTNQTKTPAAISTIGIDIGKTAFHLVGLDKRGAIVLQQKVSRDQLERRLANVPRRLIGMEVCSEARDRGRRAHVQHCGSCRDFRERRGTNGEPTAGRPLLFQAEEGRRRNLCRIDPRSELVLRQNRNRYLDGESRNRRVGARDVAAGLRGRPRHSGGQLPPIIGEVDSASVLQTLTDKPEGVASASEKPKRFIIVGLELKLRSAAG